MVRGPAWQRTKIVCTLGPGTDPPARLDALLRAGMDVARVNTAHGTLAAHRRRIRAVRRAARRLDVPVGILVDLPGPKLRIGALPGGSRELRQRQRVRLEARAEGAEAIPLAGTLLRALRPGMAMYLADGSVELRITSRQRRSAEAVVVVGGPVRSRCGVHVPEAALPTRVPTAADRARIRFAVRERADWLGVSFVRSVGDVRRVRRALPRTGGPLVLAKIETRQGLEALRSILDVADGVMVARGDLGVATDLASIPVVQKQIIGAANTRARPVVTATQMLESMVEARRPTRAEVTDVANAALDGTDAVMLSAETAVGRHPVEAVAVLHRVLTATEAAAGAATAIARLEEHRHLPEHAAHAVSFVACHLAYELNARAIVVAARRFDPLLELARFRPAPPILALAASDALAGRLTLIRGVVPLRARRNAMAAARQWLARHVAIRHGDAVVVLSAATAGAAADTLRVVRLRRPGARRTGRVAAEGARVSRYHIGVRRA